MNVGDRLQGRTNSSKGRFKFCVALGVVRSRGNSACDRRDLIKKTV